MTLPKGGLVPVPPWVMVGLRAPPRPAWMCTPHLWAPTGTEQVQTLEIELPSGWEDGRAGPRGRGSGSGGAGGEAERSCRLGVPSGESLLQPRATHRHHDDGAGLQASVPLSPGQARCPHLGLGLEPTFLRVLMGKLDRTSAKLLNDSTTPSDDRTQPPQRQSRCLCPRGAHLNGPRPGHESNTNGFIRTGRMQRERVLWSHGIKLQTNNTMGKLPTCGNLKHATE